ncbi:MAG TPA: hypothetical protein VN620_05465, partial [Candidatus Methylomirabilis sp.]|nr:hypothetical protein [Candidatus Methylomirabilis sp.]
ETLLKVIEHQAKTIGPGIRSAYHYLRSKVPEFLRDDDLFFAWYKDQDAEPLRHAPPRPRSHQGEVDDLRKGMMEYAREVQRRRDCARDSAPNAIEALDKHPDTQDVQQQPQLARSAGG